MANNYRNGNFNRSSLTKTERPLSVNSNSKPAVKSKSLPASGLRRISPASLGAAAKDDAGGKLVECYYFFFFSKFEILTVTIFKVLSFIRTRPCLDECFIDKYAVCH